MFRIKIEEGYQVAWVVNMEPDGSRKPAFYAEWVRLCR